MDTKRFAYRIRALAIGCSRPQRRGAGSFYKFTAVITPLGAPQVFAPLRRQSAVGALLKRGPATLAGGAARALGGPGKRASSVFPGVAATPHASDSHCMQKRSTRI